MAVKGSKRAQQTSRNAPGKGNGAGEMPMLRSMPESLAAEAAVVGSMIVDPRCIGDVIEVLDREAFYHTEHQLIFDAVLVLYEKNRGEGIDGVLVRDELNRNGQLDQIGGLEYLRRWPWWRVIWPGCC